MSLLLNRAKTDIDISTPPGTGTVTLGSTVAPFQSWANAQAGSSTTRRYSYLIEMGADWEIGEGVYNESAGTITRNLVASSTGSLLNITSAATIACVSKAQDSMQVIEKKTFAGGETSFTFSDIPQDFTDLELEVFGRLQNSTAVQLLNITLNANGGSVYDWQRQYALNTTNTASAGLANTTWNSVMALPGTSFISGQAGFGLMRIHGYSQTTFHKTMEGRSRWPNSTTTGDGYVLHYTGAFRSTSAVTSIEILTIPGSGQMAAGSYAVLRGIP